MTKIKILKGYLDFVVGKTYNIETADLVKDLIRRKVGKEVVNLEGKAIVNTENIENTDNLKKS
jgi:hypothetical protein